MRTVIFVRTALFAVLIAATGACIRDSVVGVADGDPTGIEPPSLATVAVEPATVSVDSGATISLSAILKNTHGDRLTGPTVTWTSSELAIASVDPQGLVSGLRPGTATITASASNKSGSAAVTVRSVTTTPPPPPPPAAVASVVVSPSSTSVDSGATVSLVATTKDASGATLTGRAVTWTSAATTVATVDGAGVVRGVRSGTATITATSEGKTGSATVTVKTVAVPPPPPSTTHVGYYVAPNGTSAGDGSPAKPWDLASALRNPGAKVQPGDTIWLRGGQYAGILRNELAGTASAPIVVRQYPGERAVLDGFIDAYGAYTVFWGFEIMQSQPLVTDKRGIDARGPGHRFINLIIHDVGGSGIGFWMEGVNSEVYGCIVYNSGSHSSLDHGIYVINRDGTKYVTDNIMFDNFAYGIHVYGQSGQALNNVRVVGNTVFNNGSIGPDIAKPNLFIGGSGIVARGMLVEVNTMYYSYDAAEINMRLGYDGTQNEDIVVRNNYASGGNPVVNFRPWSQMTMTGNTIYGRGEVVHLDQKTGSQISGNTWYRDPSASAWDYAGSALPFDGWRQTTGLSGTDVTPATQPSGVRVVVRPNKYEPGRGHVVVNNWAQQGSVAADLSAVLRAGDHFEIRSVQDLFGPALVSGTYGGGSVQIPMRPINPPATIGRATRLPPPTGPLFDAYLVQKVP